MLKLPMVQPPAMVRRLYTAPQGSPTGSVLEGVGEDGAGAGMGR